MKLRLQGHQVPRQNYHDLVRLAAPWEVIAVAQECRDAHDFAGAAYWQSISDTQARLA
jgi:hypothetical protein